MVKQATLQRIYDLGLLAVIRGPSPDLTMKIVDALVRGGVLGIEITYTTPQASAIVKSLHKRYGNEIILGMGTLTSPEQAEEAQQAGAQFIVSPHCDDRLGEAMVATGLAVMIGSYTPSEIMHARKLGSDVVKLFPGSQGGPTYMKALRGPFPDIPMMPTGGVDADNVGAWFAAGAYAVGVGSQLCPPKLADEGRFGDITALARRFVAIVAEAQAAR